MVRFVRRLSSPSSRPSVSAALLALGALLAPASSGAQEVVYALSLEGKLAVNGTQLDALSSDFELYPLENLGDAFQSLEVEGPNRYALRRDGRLYLNGKQAFKLDWYWDWISLDVVGGNAYSLRMDGAVAVNDDIEFDLPANDFFFRSIRFHQGTTYALRSNGNVFRGADDEPILRFRAGEGVFGFDDGEEFDTVWIAMEIDPATNELYVLRVDGALYKADLDTLGEDEVDDEQLVARMPFDDDDFFYAEDLYVDFTLLSDGTWVVLRADGAVFTSLSQVSPVVDYNGEADEPDNTFTDIESLGTVFWAIRGDGKLYTGLEESHVLEFPDDTYHELALGTESPDLSNFKNQKPVVSVYTTKTIIGTPLVVPLVLSDADKSAEDLIVTVEEIPEGSVWDDATRTLTWDAPAAKGTYKSVFTVDDGSGPKKYTQKHEVKEPDPTPDKNKEPLLMSLKEVQALAGYEVRFRVIVDDPDGDPLSIQVDTTIYPFTAGALFNPETREFIWTPTNEDLAKHTVQFFVSDGQKQKTLKVTIKVVSPLIF